MKGEVEKGVYSLKRRALPCRGTWEIVQGRCGLNSSGKVFGEEVKSDRSGVRRWRWARRRGEKGRRIGLKGKLGGGGEVDGRDLYT